MTATGSTTPVTTSWSIPTRLDATCRSLRRPASRSSKCRSRRRAAGRLHHGGRRPGAAGPDAAGSRCRLHLARAACVRRSVPIQRHRHRRTRLRAPPRLAREQSAPARVRQKVAVPCWCSTTSSSSTRRSTDPIRRRSRRIASPTKTRQSRCSFRIDPVFSTPNKLGPETWAGWVQERGLYFLGQRDSRYVDLVQSSDPFPFNPGIKKGALVEARVGKGRWAVHWSWPLAAAARGYRRGVPLDGKPDQPALIVERVLRGEAREATPRQEQEQDQEHPRASEAKGATGTARAGEAASE